MCGTTVWNSLPFTLASFRLSISDEMISADIAVPPHRFPGPREQVGIPGSIELDDLQQVAAVLLVGDEEPKRQPGTKKRAI